MKLPAWHRWLVYASVAAMTATGAGWLVCHYWLAPRSDGMRLPHPSEPLWLALHYATVMPALVVLGSLLFPHMQRGWWAGRSRVSGSLLIALWTALAITGLGVSYLVDDDWREVASLAHWLIGLGLPVLLAVHIWLGRVRARALNGATPRVELVD